MKVTWILIIALALVAALLGCDVPYGGTTQHTFLQDRENVVKVEICTSDDSAILHEGSNPGPLVPIAVLSGDEIDSLWEELLAFPAYELNYVAHGCGDLLFVISYTNGEQELIGYSEIGVINADGTFSGYRNHVLGDGASLTRLFARYADPEMLSKVSMSFQAHYVADNHSP